MDLLGAALAAAGDDMKIVIVEGAIDALSRRLIGRRRGECAAVIGVYSAATPCAGLPRDLLAGRRVVLAPDADAAGERACEAIAKEFRGVAGEFIRERPPAGAKDWNLSIAEPIE